MEDRYYAQYERFEDEHWWFAGRRRIIASLLETALPGPPEPGRSILDVGSGAGANLATLSRYGSVEGVESEPAAVAISRARAQRPVTLASGSELPFEAGSFDVVTMLDVIEHVADDRSILTEARRVLKPDGIALVTVPAYRWMWGAQDEISHHHRRYTRSALRDSLLSSGLTPTRLTYFNTLLFPPIAAIRLLRRLRPAQPEVRSDFELNRPGPANAILARLFGREALLLRRFDLPFGVSLAAIATLGDRS